MSDLSVMYSVTLYPPSDPHSGESGIDEEYERVVIMKYEKELEAKFGKCNVNRVVIMNNEKKLEAMFG